MGNEQSGGGGDGGGGMGHLLNALPSYMHEEHEYRRVARGGSVDDARGVSGSSSEPDLDYRHSDSAMVAAYHSDTINDRSRSAVSIAQSKSGSMSDHEAALRMRKQSAKNNMYRNRSAATAGRARAAAKRKPMTAATDGSERDDATADETYDSVTTYMRMHLRRGLNEESPDSLYLRSIDNVIEAMSRHYGVLMSRFSNLDMIRKRYNMKYVTRLVDKIEMYSATMEHSTGGHAHGDLISKNTMHASMYCNLSSTLMALEHSVTRARAIREDIRSAAKYGAGRRFTNAPSFLECLTSMRDMFMVGCTAELLKKEHHELAESMPCAFAAAVCDRNYIKQAELLDEKSIGKRTRMNGNEYMYSSLARFTHERFTNITNMIAKKERTPLFSVVVPKRYIDGGETKAAGASTPPDKVDFTQEDYVETRRMLVMHYMRRHSDRVVIASPHHELVPVDDVLIESLRNAKDDDGDYQACLRLSEIICENASAASVLLHSSAIYEKRLVSAYVTNVARNVVQNRVGEDVISVPGSRRTHYVGVNTCGAHPPGTPFGVVEMLCNALSNAAILSKAMGSTVYYACSQRDVVLRKNSMYALCGAPDQGPDFFTMAMLAQLCVKHGATDRLVCTLFGVQHCADVTPISNVFVASGQNALVPQIDELRHAKENNNASAPVHVKIASACAWYPSLTAFIVSNLRFVPTFDITLWVRNTRDVSGGVGVGGFTCMDVRVDFFAWSPFFTHDSVTYSSSGGDLVFKFDVSVDDIRKNISQMAPVSVERNHSSDIDRDAEVLFPVSWRGTKVKQYAREQLDRAYGGDTSMFVVDLRKLCVYSYTQSQSAPTYCALMSTSTFDEVTVNMPTMSARARNPARAVSTQRGELCGYRVATERAPANNASNVNWPTADRYRVMNTISEGQGERMRDIHQVSECRPCDIRMSAYAKDLHEDKATGVKCARSLCIEMSIENVDAQRFVWDVMSLYGYWPVTATAQMMSLHMPRFDEFFLKTYAGEKIKQRATAANATLPQHHSHKTTSRRRTSRPSRRSTKRR